VAVEEGDWSAEMAYYLGPGDHHKAVVLEVRMATEGGTAVPLFPFPAPELAASLIETDFNLALRAIDNRPQGLHQFGPIPRDDDETTLHWAGPPT
jgi:hypothetical protein